MRTPEFIDFGKIGGLPKGFISFAEEGKLSFEIKRVYWVYGSSEDVMRGGHASWNTEQVIIALHGKALVVTENLKGAKENFVLNTPQTGIYIPELHWKTIKLQKETILVAISSTLFDENDYIRDYSEFELMKRKNDGL